MESSSILVFLGNAFSINWLFFCISVFLAYGLGGVWYSPKILGHKWAEIINPNFKETKEEKSIILPMIVQFLATALLALAIFVGVKISIFQTTLFLIAMGGWQKASLLFKYPYFKKFLVVALIELGYFMLTIIIFLIFALL